MIKRLKCHVMYDGTHFNGFQRQLKGRTIQNELEKALTTIHKHEVEIHASGRTDAKVHAINQVFHFETVLDLEPERWKRAINALLPNDIYIKKIENESPGFHARYHAKSKEYRYYLALDEYNPFKANHVTFYQKREPLDSEKMKEAIALFIGTHDFRYFTSGNTNPNTIRTIYEAGLYEGNDCLEFRFIGSGFLRYQVRVMIGTLIEIGEGKKEITVITNLLNLKPGRAGKTAKPQGLYLYDVTYYPHEERDY